MTTALETALARHRTWSIAALAALVMLAWTWLFLGAGMDMGTSVSLAPPGAGGDAMPGMAMDMPMEAPAGWTGPHFALVVAMWWIMMVAMMLPSAAPTMLLYARVATKRPDASRPATGAFLAGYLAAWGGFSALAALLQRLGERVDLLAPQTMASHSAQLSGAILVAAGIYQLSPLKRACLRHCQNPAQFLSRHYLPGAGGALRMGLVHGTWCVGCCWLLMALLFVGGIMNLAWIALLSVMVAAEKLMRRSRVVSLVLGLACLGWGAVLLLA